jgi:hypothetical protein
MFSRVGPPPFGDVISGTQPWPPARGRCLLSIWPRKYSAPIYHSIVCDLFLSTVLYTADIRLHHPYTPNFLTMAQTKDFRMTERTSRHPIDEPSLEGSRPSRDLQPPVVSTEEGEVGDESESIVPPEGGFGWVVVACCSVAV